MKYSSQNEAGKSYEFVGTGDYEACKEAVEPLMNLTVTCAKRPCSLNGVHQPHIDLSAEFYGFSEFWYSTEDVFKIGGHYNHEEFEDKAKVGILSSHFFKLYFREKKMLCLLLYKI